MCRINVRHLIICILLFIVMQAKAQVKLNYDSEKVITSLKGKVKSILLSSDSVNYELKYFFSKNRNIIKIMTLDMDEFFWEIDSFDYDDQNRNVYKMHINSQEGINSKLEHYYTYDNSNNKIKAAKYINEEKADIYLYEYDSNGNQTRVCCNNNKGSIKFDRHIKNKYNSDRKLIKIETYDTGKRIMNAIEYQHKDNGYIEKIIQFEKNMDTLIIATTTYDNNGNIIKYEIADDNKITPTTSESKFNDKNEKTETIIINLDMPENNACKKYSYDPIGNVTEIRDISLGRDQKTTFEYIYDKYNNWIIKKSFWGKEKELQYIIYRKFEYWE